MDIRISGTLLAVAATPYGEFRNSQTGELVAAGTAYTAHILTAPMTKPVEVKINEDMARALDSLIGKRVIAQVSTPATMKVRASEIVAA